MVTPEQQLRSAYGAANALLELEPRITQEALEQAVDTILAMPPYASVDRTRLLRELEARNNTLVGGYSIIDDKEFVAWVKTAARTGPLNSGNATGTGWTAASSGHPAR